MPIEEPNTWLQGATALQTGFGAVPSVVGLVRDTEKAPCGGKVHNKVHKKFIDQPLDHAVSVAATETEISKAQGHVLCKCNFSPTIILTVGYVGAKGEGRSEAVYECPKCGSTTAGRWACARTAPSRVVDNSRGILTRRRRGTRGVCAIVDQPIRTLSRRELLITVLTRRAKTRRGLATTDGVFDLAVWTAEVLAGRQ
jgi:hypothetical protein